MVFVTHNLAVGCFDVLKALRYERGKNHRAGRHFAPFTKPAKSVYTVADKLSASSPGS